MGERKIPITLPEQLQKEMRISWVRRDGSIYTPQYIFPEIYRITDGRKDMDFLMLNRLKITDVTHYTTQASVHFPYSDGDGEEVFDMEIDAISLSARRTGLLALMVSDIVKRTFDIRYAGSWTVDPKRYGTTEDEIEEYTGTLVANYQSAQRSEIKRLHDILAEAQADNGVLRVWPA